MEERELGGMVASLKEQRAEIEGAIKSLSSTGIDEIAAVKSKAESELGSFIEELRHETKTLGEAKAEAARLERELTYARYLTADDDQALSAAPRGSEAGKPRGTICPPVSFPSCRLGLPKAIKDWSLRSLQLKLIKMGGGIVRHARQIVLQLAEVAVPRELFAAILRLGAGQHTEGT